MNEVRRLAEELRRHAESARAVAERLRKAAFDNLSDDVLVAVREQAEVLSEMRDSADAIAGSARQGERKKTT